MSRNRTAAAVPNSPDAAAAVATDDGQGIPATAIAMLPQARPASASAHAAGVIQRRRFRDAKPINFGASSPRQLAVHGVDVSRWQGQIDWQKVKGQGANFAYIKATDGGDHLDPMFHKNWREAGRAGLRRGAYHFFYWCRRASEQADWFIRNVPKVEGALPPVLDVEWNGQSSCRRRPAPRSGRTPPVPDARRAHREPRYRCARRRAATRPVDGAVPGLRGW